MRKFVLPLLLFSFLLGGCVSEPTQYGVHPQKAAEINAELGLRYMQMGKYDVAMVKLNRSLKYEPDYAPAHHYLAELYRRLGRPDDAMEHFERALELTPDDPALLNNYGVFLCNQKHYARAEKEFLHVLDDPVYPKRAQVYENLGLCFHDKPDYNKAEMYLRKALAENPKLPKSLYNMADISYRRHNLFSARAYLQRHLTLAQPSPQAYWLGIEIERGLGDARDAKHYGVQLLKRFPDSDEATRYRELLKR